MEILSCIAEILYRHKDCSLPGIGRWKLEYSPAAVDMAAQIIYPPQQQITFHYDTTASDETLTSFIAGKENIAPETARLKIAKITRELKQQLDEGRLLEIPLIGALTKNILGSIDFTPSTFLNEGWLPLEAIPAVHREAGYTEPAGAQSAKGEPAELLMPVASAPERKYNWMIWLLGAIIAGAAGWLIFHYSAIQGPAATNPPAANAPPQHQEEVPLIKDSTQNKPAGDSTQVPISDSMHYAIVFATYTNRTNAEKLYHKMKGWGHEVELLTDSDSLHFHLAKPVTALPQDTVQQLEDVRKTYGGNPYIYASQQGH